MITSKCRRKCMTIIVSSVFALSGVASAQAASVVSPANGATVDAKPTFQFDFFDGSVDVELSALPDVMTAGRHAGSFVDPSAGDFFILRPGDPLPGQAVWGQLPLNAGRYYWHVKTSNYDDVLPTGTDGLWQPTMTLTVRDEPIVFEGWTFTARRIRTKKRCRTEVAVLGKLVYTDNVDDSNRGARYSITVKAGRKTVGQLHGSLGADSSGDYAGIVCTKAAKLSATATLRDAAGHVSPGTLKIAIVRR